jgi:hypothetical protein
MTTPTRNGIKKPKVKKGAPIVKVDKTTYDNLVIRSRTLGALGLGGGMTCPKCHNHLIVKDVCPGCQYNVVIED